MPLFYHLFFSAVTVLRWSPLLKTVIYSFYSVCILTVPCEVRELIPSLLAEIWNKSDT